MDTKVCIHNKLYKIYLNCYGVCEAVLGGPKGVLNLMNTKKAVVTVSVTGSITPTDVTNLPITPQQIADSAVEAWRAGAAVAHIHVRDPANGMPSMEFEYYREVFERIRGESDMIINLSTGAGARVIPDDNDPIGLGPGTTLTSPVRRIEHVVRLKPEICSLDVGSIDFGRHVFVNYIAHIESMAEMAREAGVKVEMEVFNLGHVEIARRLVETGRVLKPPLFQLCLGIPLGIPATPLNMIIMKQALPQEALWSGFGIAASNFSMIAQAAILGGHVRTGMEDNLYLEKGVRAKSNAELIAKAVNIIRLLGREPATPGEARELLGLS